MDNTTTTLGRTNTSGADISSARAAAHARNGGVVAAARRKHRHQFRVGALFDLRDGVGDLFALAVRRKNPSPATGRAAAAEAAAAAAETATATAAAEPTTAKPTGAAASTVDMPFSTVPQTIARARPPPPRRPPPKPLITMNSTISQKMPTGSAFFGDGFDCG